MNKLISTNPSTLEPIGSVPITGEKEIGEKVAKARQALASWRNFSLKDRAYVIKNIMLEFSKRSEEFARLITQEMGMPITQSRLDVREGLHYLQWYAENAEKYLSPEIIYKDRAN